GEMSKFYNYHQKETPVYEVGSKVWLDAQDIKTTRPIKKLDNKWFRPFEVQKMVNPNAYRLKLPCTLQIHPVFPISKLSPFQPDTIKGQHPQHPPPPVVTN